jgi:hypothetical protein
MNIYGQTMLKRGKPKKMAQSGMYYKKTVHKGKDGSEKTWVTGNAKRRTKVQGYKSIDESGIYPREYCEQVLALHMRTLKRAEADEKTYRGLITEKLDDDENYAIHCGLYEPPNMPSLREICALIPMEIFDVTEWDQDRGSLSFALFLSLSLSLYIYIYIYVYIYIYI